MSISTRKTQLEDGRDEGIPGRIKDMIKCLYPFVFVLTNRACLGDEDIPGGIKGAVTRLHPRGRLNWTRLTRKA